MKYIVGYLNSSFAIKQLLDNSPKTGTGDVIISVQALEPLLIPQCDGQKKKDIERLVDNLLNNSNINYFQEEINSEFKQILNLSDVESKTIFL